MDEADVSSERELFEREIQIKASVAATPPAPNLGCMECNEITQEHAKAHCRDFKTCLSDWQKIERLQIIKGTK